MALEALSLHLPPEIQRKLSNGTLTLLTCDELAVKAVDTYNHADGGLRGPDCPQCRNKGSIMYLDSSGTRRLRECACMARRRSLERLERSGLSNLLESCTLEAFQTCEPWQRTAKETAMRFLSETGGKWFVSAGAVGSGKTHLCTAVCGELLNAGKEVRYMLWRDDGGRMKAAVNDSEVYLPLVKPLKIVDVLYIDDFFKGKVTDGDVHLAFELLNTRYNNLALTTIISSEKTIAEIMEIDEAVGSRIYERSKGYYLQSTGGGRNWRLRHGNR